MESNQGRHERMAEGKNNPENNQKKVTLSEKAALGLLGLSLAAFAVVAPEAADRTLNAVGGETLAQMLRQAGFAAQCILGVGILASVAIGISKVSPKRK
jgi:hypothetical protein